MDHDKLEDLADTLGDELIEKILENPNLDNDEQKEIFEIIEDMLKFRREHL